MTTTLGQAGSLGTRRHLQRGAAVHRRSMSASLGMVGVIAVVISTWGAIIPYVGPTFGYSADGASSWQWNLTHSVLALVPGAIGFLIGLSFFAPVRTSTLGRRLSLGVAGTIAIAAGAWFVIGPLAWPVISDVSQYFVPAAPLRNLANQVGYALGPGLILAACGAFAIGWATRHSQPLGAGDAGETEASPVGPLTSQAPLSDERSIDTGAPGAMQGRMGGPPMESPGASR